MIGIHYNLISRGTTLEIRIRKKTETRVAKLVKSNVAECQEKVALNSL